MLKKIFLVFGLLFIFMSARPVWAQEVRDEVMEGKVAGSVKEDIVQRGEDQLLYQELRVEVTKGSLAGQTIMVETEVALINRPKYMTGDEVQLMRSTGPEGEEIVYITDYVRRTPLAVLLGIFVVMTVVVGRGRGASSLLGLAISFAVIFFFVLPQIYTGSDPVVISMVAAVVIVPATFFLSHGINKKTGIAIAGTFVALVITGVLAKVFIDLAQLTGFSSEEAGFLQAARGGAVNIRGLVLAGIMIGALGVLDDITVAQAALAQQLREANPKLKPGELFSRAMKVGQDHIASMVNTLVLVYAGAALPLLLLFIDNPQPFSQLVNYEIIAEEVIRTLVSSIGLISAVPVTTWLASRGK